MPTSRSAAALGVDRGRMSAKRRTVAIGAVGVVVIAAVAYAAGSRASDPAPAGDLSPIAAVRTDGWAPFRPPDGAFRVDLPSTPTRTEQMIEGSTRLAVVYESRHLDVVYRVVQLPAPEYVAPYQASLKLKEWFAPHYVMEGATIEHSLTLESPHGDQVFDAVVVDAAGRHWVRSATWRGDLIYVLAITDSSRPPTAAQTSDWSRVRDSLRQ